MIDLVTAPKEKVNDIVIRYNTTATKLGWSHVVEQNSPRVKAVIKAPFVILRGVPFPKVPPARTIPNTFPIFHRSGESDIALHVTTLKRQCGGKTLVGLRATGGAGYKILQVMGAEKTEIVKYSYLN